MLLGLAFAALWLLLARASIEPFESAPATELQVLWRDPGVYAERFEAHWLPAWRATLPRLNEVAAWSADIRHGQVQLRLRFQPGVDAATALDRVTEELRPAPTMRAAPEITVLAPQDSVDVIVSSTTHDPGGLQDWVDQQFVPALVGLTGVARVERLGGAQQQVTLVPDARRLAALGLAPLDVMQRVRAALAAPADGGPTHRRIDNLAALKSLSVPLPGGERVALSELVRAQPLTTVMRQWLRVGGLPALRVRIVARAPMLRLETTERVRSHIAWMRANGEIPQSLRLTLTRDPTQVVRATARATGLAWMLWALACVVVAGAVAGSFRLAGVAVGAALLAALISVALLWAVQHPLNPASLGGLLAGVALASGYGLARGWSRTQPGMRPLRARVLLGGTLSVLLASAAIGWHSALLEARVLFTALLVTLPISVFVNRVWVDSFRWPAARAVTLPRGWVNRRWQGATRWRVALFLVVLLMAFDFPVLPEESAAPGAPPAVQWIVASGSAPVVERALAAAQTQPGVGPWLSQWDTNDADSVSVTVMPLVLTDTAAPAQTFAFYQALWSQRPPATAMRFPALAHDQSPVLELRLYADTAEEREARAARVVQALRRQELLAEREATLKALVPGVTWDLERLDRLGLEPADGERLISAAVQGLVLGQFREGGSPTEVRFSLPDDTGFAFGARTLVAGETREHPSVYLPTVAQLTGSAARAQITRDARGEYLSLWVRRVERDALLPVWPRLQAALPALAASAGDVAIPVAPSAAPASSRWLLPGAVLLGLLAVAGWLRVQTQSWPRLVATLASVATAALMTLYLVASFHPLSPMRGAVLLGVAAALALWLAQHWLAAPGRFLPVWLAAIPLAIAGLVWQLPARESLPAISALAMTLWVVALLTPALTWLIAPRPR
jgi:multidrug efflux pump subunit AcrB